MTNSSYQNLIKSIRSRAYTCTFGSMGILLVAIALQLFWKQRFYADNNTYRMGLVAGVVIAVAVIAINLRAQSKGMRQIRSLSSMGEKLAHYQSSINTTYTLNLAATIILSLLVVLINCKELIMLAILMVLELLLMFPNMYRMKVDMGLDDEEMINLFGNQYIPYQDTTTQEAEVVDNTDNSDPNQK